MPAAIFVLGFGLSAANLPAAEFVWDDTYVIAQNPDIKDLSRVPSLFTSSWAGRTESSPGREKNVNFYRPMAGVSYALDYALWGATPVMFRLTNDVFHGLACVMVYLLLTALGLPFLSAVLGAAFFAAHPVHTEVTSVVAYRTTLLAAVFYLTAMYCHAQFTPGRIWWAVASAASATLAFFSKESAATLPAALVLVDLALQRRASPRSVLLQYVPVLVSLTAYLVIRSFVVAYSPPGAAFAGMSAGVKALTMLKTMALYTRVLLVPWPLCAYYDPSILTPTASMLEPEVIAGFAFILTWVTGIAITLKRRKPIAALLLFVPVTLAPFVHIIPLRTIAGERFLYLPSVAWCGLLGLAICKLPEACKGVGTQRWSRVAATAVAAILLTGYATVTVVRQLDWRTNETIMLAKIRDFPESFDAHFAYGRYLLDVQRRPVDALPYLERAAQIWPGFQPAVEYVNRAKKQADHR